MASIFGRYGLRNEHIVPLVATLRANPDRWLDFMMRFELGLEKPNPSRARNSAGTIAGSYVVGGLVPLCPYFLGHSARSALWYSVGFTLLTLLIFGYVKGRFTGVRPLKSGLQTVVIGGIAAAAAFAIARLIT